MFLMLTYFYNVALYLVISLIVECKRSMLPNGCKIYANVMIE